MKRVVVHIDRVVLNGFRNTDAHAVGGGMRIELERLLTEPAAADRVASLPHLSSLHTGKIRLAHDAKPQRLGIAVGGEIAKGLAR